MIIYQANDQDKILGKDDSTIADVIGTYQIDCDANAKGTFTNWKQTKE
jgi:hypothetical protein